MEFFKDSFILPDAVSCIDGGTAALNLLSAIEGFSHLIIIDAIASNDPPGTILRISGEDLGKGPELKTTAHQLGVLDLLRIAGFEGYSPETVIIGVVPKEISPGLELTPLIKGVLPRAADMIREELIALGFDVKKRHKDA